MAVIFMGFAHGQLRKTALCGLRLLPGRQAIRYVKSLGGKPEAGVIGTRIVTSAANVALANGRARSSASTHARRRPYERGVPALRLGVRCRLEQFNEIAGWVFKKNLSSATSTNDLVAEHNARLFQRVRLIVKITALHDYSV